MRGLCSRLPLPARPRLPHRYGGSVAEHLSLTLCRDLLKDILIMKCTLHCLIHCNSGGIAYQDQPLIELRTGAGARVLTFCPHISQNRKKNNTRSLRQQIDFNEPPDAGSLSERITYDSYSMLCRLPPSSGDSEVGPPEVFGFARALCTNASTVGCWSSSLRVTVPDPAVARASTPFSITVSSLSGGVDIVRYKQTNDLCLCRCQLYANYRSADTAPRVLSIRTPSLQLCGYRPCMVAIPINLG